mgnify:CR=1 FL=1
MTHEELLGCLRAHAAVGGVPEEEIQWLAAHGVSIAALSESEFVGRHVPLLTPQSFVERLRERRG